MMKLAVTVLSLFLVLSPSQAKTSSSAQDLDFRERSALKNQMLTKNVRALVARKHQRRLIVTNDLSDGDDGPPSSDELDMQSPYRRPQVVNTPEPIDDISDYASVRLAVARARAMAKYREKWC